MENLESQDFLEDLEKKDFLVSPVVLVQKVPLVLLVLQDHPGLLVRKGFQDLLAYLEFSVCLDPEVKGALMVPLVLQV